MLKMKISSTIFYYITPHVIFVNTDITVVQFWIKIFYNNAVLLAYKHGQCRIIFSANTVFPNIVTPYRDE